MRLNVETTGEGRDLVLVHGWGMNGGVWEPLVSLLAADYRLTVIELPGHGASEYDASLETLDDWSGSLLHAAPERAAWLGWSLGGQLAMKAALLAPERVSALVLMATTPKFVVGDGWPHALAPEIFHQFNQRLMADPAATLSRFLALQVLGTAHEKETLRQLKQVMQQRRDPRADALVNGLSLLLETDLRASLGDIEPPMLWLLGRRDALVPRGMVHELTALLPKAQIRLLDRAAHALFLSHLQDCGKLLQEFLSD